MQDETIEEEVLAVAVMDRKRDETGKFAVESNLGKVFGVRLAKETQEQLESIASEQGLAPTLLIRQIVSDWVERNQSKKR